MGSGPYRVERFSQANLELVLNPYYHASASIKNEGLSLVFQPEKGTLDNLTKYKPAGSVMLLSNLGGKHTIEGYYKNTHIPYVTQTLVLNPKIYPFNNKAFRRLIQSDFYNKGKLHECSPAVSQSYGFIPYGIGGSFTDKPLALPAEQHSNELITFINDLKKQPTRLKIYQHLGRKNTCEESRIKMLFQQYNIDTEILYLSDYIELDKLSLSDKAQGYIELFVFLTRDSSKMLSRFAPNPSNPNLFHWTSQEINRLLKKSRKFTSLQKRLLQYRKINRVIYDNANVIDLYYVGQTNFFHRCYDVAQPELSFNPNSFYLLKSLNRRKNCRIN
jgi:ABC-type oligopeptide transport system substrate-binding subunit